MGSVELSCERGNEMSPRLTPTATKWCASRMRPSFSATWSFSSGVSGSGFLEYSGELCLRVWETIIALQGG